MWNPTIVIDNLWYWNKWRPFYALLFDGPHKRLVWIRTHCRRSLPCCQNTESWKRCRLWWNPKWNAQSLESRSSLADSRVSSGLVFWESTKRLANWGDHAYTQEWKQERNHFRNTPKTSLCMLCLVYLEKVCDRVRREKLWGVSLWKRCWRPPVTGRQVTVFLLKSLCSYRRSWITTVHR